MNLHPDGPTPPLPIVRNPAQPSTMLQAATAFFKTSQISQNYAIASTSTGLPSSNLSTSGPAAPFHLGLWKIQEAVHKSNGKKASVWSFDKRGVEMERLSQTGAKERVIEVLKAEVSNQCPLLMVAITETRDQGIRFGSPQTPLRPR